MEKSLQNIKEMAAQLPQELREAWTREIGTAIESWCAVSEIITDVPPKRVRNALVQTASPEEWVKLVESRDWVETYEDAKSLIAQRWPMGSFRVGMESYNPLATPRGGDAVVVLGPQPSKEQPVATLLAAGHPEMVKYLEADGEGDCARYVLLTKSEEKGETLETWYFALEELKEAVQDLKRIRLEVMLPTKAEPMCFRKLLDIVFGRTQVTVTLCLPPAPKPASQVATTRTAVKRSATRPIALPGKGKVRKADATSTILVSNKDQEFPELLKTVKEALKNQDVGVELKAATATKRGDVLLSVKGGKDLSKIQEVLTSKTGATVTTRLAGERLVLVKDIDASICDKEVIAAIRSAFPDKNTESVKVESLRSSYKDGPQTARVRAEKGLVDAMLERGKIRVGILTCRVRPVVEVDRCARCGAITHRASQCTKGKRSCFKCGGEGHEARSCKETKVFCTSCNKEGHNAGSIRCPLYSWVVSMETQRVQTRRPTPPTKKPPGPIREERLGCWVREACPNRPAYEDENLYKKSLTRWRLLQFSDQAGCGCWMQQPWLGGAQSNQVKRLWEVVRPHSTQKTPYPRSGRSPGMDPTLSPEATLVAYSDDLALVVIEKDIENLMCTVEMTSKIIGRWMKENGLQLTPEKTEAVLLAGARRPDKNVVFKVENVELRPKQNVRYLGVDINQRMTFTSHVMRVAGKAEKMGAMLRRLMPNVKGPSPSKRKVMAEVVNSIVMYAAPIWGPTALDILKYQERLAQVQRKTALRVCSAYRTVSADAVQVIAGMIPIDLRIHEIVKMECKFQRQMDAASYSKYKTVDRKKEECGSDPQEPALEAATPDPLLFPVEAPFDPEILLLLGAPQNSEEPLGEPIHASIAKKWTAVLQKSFRSGDNPSIPQEVPCRVQLLHVRKTP
ncbi:hypothetical protein TcasGA2_TC033921 [Tribolium castaneum]|uniref:CCHC-type domain-containing protein n=1 Tax=Tribolium castaneum TaxID=7070 RepID=A0A139WDJ6_TRICA|nr:hypothetical protein TcasGA2_TC033921 [Tribolium castaneum]